MFDAGEVERQRKRSEEYVRFFKRKVAQQNKQLLEKDHVATGCQENVVERNKKVQAYRLM